MKKIALIITYLSIFWSGISQTIHTIDSLKSRLSTIENHDSNYFKLLDDIMWEYLYVNPDSSIYYAESLFNIAKNQKNLEFQAKSQNLIGVANYVMGKMDKAIVHYKKSEELSLINGDTLYAVMTMTNIGNIYYVEGLYPQALDIIYKSLIYFEKNKDTLSVASCHTTLGNIANDNKEFDKSIEHFQKALEIYQFEKDVQSVGAIYANIASVYETMDVYNKSIEYYLKALSIFNNSENYKSLAVLNTNLSKLLNTIVLSSISFDKIKNELHLINKSIKSKNEVLFISDSIAKKAIDFAKIIHDDYVIIHATMEVVNVKYINEQYNDAVLLLNSILPIALATEGVKEERLLYGGLYKNHKALGNFEIALESYEKELLYRDSVVNEETQKATIRQHTKYEFEKEQLIKEQQLKDEIRNQKLETERRNNLQYSIILVAILFVFGSVLVLGKINVSPKFAEGLIFFAFLIFFEFCLVLLDPYVDQFSGGEPAYKLLFNAVLAAAIFPLHAFFEIKLKSKIIKL